MKTGVEEGQQHDENAPHEHILIRCGVCNHLHSFIRIGDQLVHVEQPCQGCGMAIYFEIHP